MAATSASTETRAQTSLRNPAVQAFWTLRIGFAALPILFGIDKFANVLTGNWTKYLSHDFNNLMPGSAAADMHFVGIVEIVAGVVVLLAPRIGGPLVALWLAGIIVNLIDLGGYGDVALRDFGLMVGAITLSRLAWALPGRLFGELSR